MAKWPAMKRVSGRNRLLIAVLAVAVAAGVAGGIVLAGGDSGRTADPAGILARGTFKTVSWGTRGTAIIERTGEGKLVLRFDQAFSTRRAPETWVYLVQYDERTHRGDRGKTLMLGELQNFVGGQHYDLPGSAARMVGYSVEIYCGECNKTNGIAALRPTALGKT